VIAAWIVALGLLGASLQDAPAQGAPAAAAAVDEERLEAQTKLVASQLRCVVCQGLSIQDSPSTLAQEMRALVKDKLAAGMTPAEVKLYFVDRYGEFVLLEPDPTGFNLVVYILPVVILVGGAAFVWMKARQWTARSPAAAPAAPEDVHV
jgi:cytochrome c-type biogenesis protein CcmH